MAVHESDAFHEPLFQVEGQRADTDGTIVVWLNDGIWAASVAGGQPRLVAPVTEMDEIFFLSVSSDYVVWLQSVTTTNRDLHGFNLATGEHIDVEVSANDASYPVLSGSIVIWVTFLDTDQVAIVGRDLATMEPPFVVQEIDGGLLYLSLSGDRIAWGTFESVENRNVVRVRSKRIGDLESTVVDEWLAIGGSLYGMGLSGDLLVYSRDWQLVVRDLKANTELAYHLPNKVYSTVTDGRYVFWEAWQDNADNELENNILGFDTQTRSLFTVIDNEHLNQAPVAANGYLIWHDEFNEIFGMPIGDVLPNGPRSAETDARLDWQFLPETQHYLHHGFKGYWDQHGGIPVFGYPLTEEFSETEASQQPDRNDNTFQTVQLFERQRFEWHPENLGTPYEVLLGHLGVEAAERAGLLDTEPFQPRSADQIIPSHCTSFTEIAHLICLPFVDYWSSHGADLGDAGVSYRESLALFGYPISEGFVDPETGLFVQYFERAVFEFHPNNPIPYQILLRRLGADALSEYEW